MKSVTTIRLILLALLSVTFATCVSEKPNRLDLEMVRIPAGEFTMGTSRAYASADRSPQHVVFLGTYQIGKFEITNKQYHEFIMAGGYRKREVWTPEGWQFITQNQIVAPAAWNLIGFNNPSQPAVGMSWYEAAAFAKWAGKRLPTEAEWEKAARGTDGRVYPWGEDISVTAVYYNAMVRPQTVGSYPAGKSPFGLYDVAGNVWEWVQDWYDPNIYKNRSNDIPSGPVLGEHRVMRGGGWDSNRRHMQCTYRQREKPTWRRLNTGFRVAENVNELR